MEEINELKERLLRSIKKLNADASENFEDYKMIKLFSLKKNCAARQNVLLLFTINLYKVLAAVLISCYL